MARITILLFTILLFVQCSEDNSEVVSPEDSFFRYFVNSTFLQEKYKVHVIATDEENRVISSVPIEDADVKIIKPDSIGRNIQKYNFYEIIINSVPEYFIVNSYLSINPGVIDKRFQRGDCTSTLEISSETPVSLVSSQCGTVETAYGRTKFSFPYNPSSTGTYFQTEAQPPKYLFLQSPVSNSITLKAGSFKNPKSLIISLASQDFVTSFFLLRGYITGDENHTLQTSRTLDIIPDPVKFYIPQESLFTKYYTLYEFFDENGIKKSNEYFGEIPTQIFPAMNSGSIINDKLNKFIYSVQGDIDFIEVEWEHRACYYDSVGTGGICGTNGLINFLSPNNSTDLILPSAVTDLLSNNFNFNIEDVHFSSLKTVDAEPIDTYDDYIDLLLKRSGKRLIDENIEIKRTLTKQ